MTTSTPLVAPAAYLAPVSVVGRPVGRRRPTTTEHPNRADDTPQLPGNFPDYREDFAAAGAGGHAGTRRRTRLAQRFPRYGGDAPGCHCHGWMCARLCARGSGCVLGGGPRWGRTGGPGAGRLWGYW